MRTLKNVDWLILVCTFFILLFGAITISMVPNNLLFRHIISIVIGVFVLVLFASSDYRMWDRGALFFYILTILLLLFVFFFGQQLFGARRWIDLSFFQIQPSELAKLAFVFILSKFFIDNNQQRDSFKYVFTSLLIIALPLVLIFLQPDLGTAITLLFIWFMLFLATLKKGRYLVFILTLFIIFAPIMFHYGLADYQKKRLTSFINPAVDPFGSGYNVVQAKIAVGSGSIFGQGLYSFDFLPSTLTDFIFAVFAHRFGFVGSIIFISLYAVLLLRIIVFAFKTYDSFAKLLLIGIFSMLFIQFFVNVGMNLGIMPITGIPLPFFSFGGTSMVVSFMAIGIVVSISKRQRHDVYR